jgi:cysteine desulfurase
MYVRDGVRIDPLLFGGPQEWGRRAGHEDVAASVAIATALSVAARERDSRADKARGQSERLRDALSKLGGSLTGSEHRLPNFASCTFADRKGEDMLLAVDMAGVAASSGSACASGSLDPSHVLLAMGLSLEESLGSLRLTTGYTTTDAEIARSLEILHRVLARTPSHA